MFSRRCCQLGSRCENKDKHNCKSLKEHLSGPESDREKQKQKKLNKLLFSNDMYVFAKILLCMQKLAVKYTSVFSTESLDIQKSLKFTF